MPNFTTEDLLVYLYDEMKPDQARELEDSLGSDWALHQKYQVFLEARTNLDAQPLYSPRVASVSRILAYAEESLHLSN